MAKKTKRSRRKAKTQQLVEEENIIDFGSQREARRAQLREQAEAKRKKKGRKSIKQEILDEVTWTDAPPPEKKKAGKAKDKPKKKISTTFKAVIIVAIVLILFFAKSASNIVSLEYQKISAEKRLEQLQKEKESLEEQVANLGSDEYVEEQARNWLKMAKQGEILYVLDSDKANADKNQQSNNGNQ